MEQNAYAGHWYVTVRNLPTLNLITLSFSFETAVTHSVTNINRRHQHYVHIHIVSKRSTIELSRGLSFLANTSERSLS